MGAQQCHVVWAGHYDVASQSPITRFSGFIRNDKHCGLTQELSQKEARHIVDNLSQALAAFITTRNEDYAIAKCTHRMAKLLGEVAVKLCLSLTSTFLTL